VERHVRVFKTTTADLLALGDWLAGLQVAAIALESTGVYWRPVYNLLEGEGRALVLVNPQHMRAVPGRKTDVRDSEWLAELLRHGLLKASFIPPAPVRALRELTRYRKTLVQQRAEEANRLQKALEGANLKLGDVASNVLGVSGRAMLEALLGGEQDPEALADLARGRLRAKLPELRQALLGRVQPHHLVLVRALLAHIDFLEEAIARLQEEIEARLPAFGAEHALLLTIPGVGAVAAAAILAEIGPDMGRFPTAKHLASWAGLCPGNRQSGGKRLKGPTTKGNVWLRGIMGEAAWGSIRQRDTYFGAQFHRLARRRGRQKAVVAVAHSLLVVIYHVLRDRRPYHELGAGYFDALDAARTERHHVRRLEQLGYTVQLSPKEAA
jgi:transposase